MIRKILQEKYLTIILWLTFSVIVGTLYLYQFLHVIHPHPFPAYLFFSIFLPVNALLMTKGFLKFLFWSDRLKTAGWVFLGVTPLFIILWGGVHWWEFNSQRRQNDYVTRMGPISSYASGCLKNMERAIYYPFSVEGEKVVMWTDWKDWNVGARQNVDQMDEFIKKFEKKFNRKCTTKVNWVRSEMKYYHGTGWNYHGPVSGSYPENLIEGKDFQLKRTDRYGVANFVIQNYCGPNAQPPKLLKDGWRMSFYDNQDDDYQLYKIREKHLDISLDELIKDDTYNDFPGYTSIYGAVFCDYLFRTYSNEKFLELYSTSRKETFPDDIKRIYKITFEELKKNFWADFDIQVSSEKYLKKNHFLYAAKLSQDIDKDSYKELIKNHRKGYQELLKSFEKCQYVTKYQKIQKGTNAKHVYGPVQFEYFQNGPYSKLVDEYQTYFATPEHSFTIGLSDEKEHSQWGFPSNSNNEAPKFRKRNHLLLKELISQSKYNIQKNLLHRIYMEGHAIPVIYAIEKDLNWTATHIEKVTEDGHLYWKLDGQFMVDGNLSTFTITFDPQNNWAIRSVNGKGKYFDNDYTYTKTIHFPDDKTMLPHTTKIVEDYCTYSPITLEKQSSKKTILDITRMPIDIDKDDLQPERYGINPADLYASSEKLSMSLYAFFGFIILFVTGVILLFVHYYLKKKHNIVEVLTNAENNSKKPLSRFKKWVTLSLILLFLYVGHQLLMVQLRKKTWAKASRKTERYVELNYRFRYPNLFFKSFNNVGNKYFQYVIDTLKGKIYNEIIYIDYMNVFKMNDYSFDQLPASEEMTQVLIEESDVSNKGMENLLKYPNLHTLRLEGKKISNPVLEICGKLKKLVHLYLSSTAISDEGLKHLVDHTSLESIDLSNTEITDQGMKYLSQIPGLKSVILDQTKITDKGLEIVSKNQSLKELQLNGTKITDQGIEFLKDHPTLERLELENTEISDKSIDVILSIKRLKEIRIDDTKVSKEGVQKLKEQINIVLD